MASLTKQPVLRNDKHAKEVAGFRLPRWDRSGNAQDTEPAEPATQVEDLAAEDIAPPTVAEITSLREDAYNEGFESGYATGLAQGKQEGKAQGLQEGKVEGHTAGLAAGSEAAKAEALVEEREKTDQKLAVLQAVSEQLQQHLAREQPALQEALLNLAMRIAQQVLQEELRLKPEHILSLVQTAVNSLPSPDQKLTIYLNPSDLDLVTSIAQPHWTLTADGQLSRGGCRVKAGFSYIDYSLEQRFDTAVSDLSVAAAEPQETEPVAATAHHEQAMLTEPEASDSSAATAGETATGPDGAD